MMHDSKKYEKMDTECEVQHILMKNYIYPLYKDLKLLAQEKEETCEHITDFLVIFPFGS